MAPCKPPGMLTCGQVFALKVKKQSADPPNRKTVSPIQGAAKAGGTQKQCGGRLCSRPPQRDPIFRDAKVLLFWCDQQQKEYGSIPL
ncbi:hypothetical protein, partial [Faecalibacterium sp. An58]|uniref:hypothetical protein n=1 Tax=Faecalibacterium sp. An58 TaxID=1965648 RepID=UPI001951867E